MRDFYRSAPAVAIRNRVQDETMTSVFSLAPNRSNANDFCMNPESLQFRRATVDDAEALAALWASAGLDAERFAKRLTEFQVAEGADYQIVGAIGLRVTEQQGWIHSEAFADGAELVSVREALADRVLNVAKNYGLWRIWTNEASDFWEPREFSPATPEEMEVFPKGFGVWKDAWWTLKLRDEMASAGRLEQEMQMMQLGNQSDNDQLLQRAKAFKAMATVITVIVAMLLVGLLIFMVKQGNAPR
jgi:N-acetylglutamate synthase-like GNAT family acetyltransferase